jgi:hypothetical protein
MKQFLCEFAGLISFLLVALCLLLTTRAIKRAPEYWPFSSPDAIKPIYARVVIFGVGLIWGVLGMLSIRPAIFSFMLFDAPGSDSNPLVIVTVLGITSFPVACFFSAIKSQECHAKRRFIPAIRWLCLPLWSVTVAALGFGVAALVNLNNLPN